MYVSVLSDLGVFFHGSGNRIVWLIFGKDRLDACWTFEI